MIMWSKKIIWWLLLVHTFNEIWGFIPLHNSRRTVNIHKHQQLVQLIKMCFSNRSNPLVLTDNLINIINQDTQETMQSPITIVDDNFKAKNIPIFNPTRPTYFLSTDSDSKLKNFLKEFESMSTWSIESLFFIVDLTNINTCKNAPRVLQTLWKKELLFSFYVCNEPLSDTILIFTLNPYGPHATHPWKKVETNDNDQPDNRQTLFFQAYVNDNSICQTFTFDKTKVLDGYPVKAIGTPKSKSKLIRGKAYGKEVVKKKLPYFQGMFFSTLFSAMNVTPLVYFDDEGYYENGEAKGYLKSLINGTIDIGMGLRRLYVVPNELIEIVELYNEDGFLILTLKRSFEIPDQPISNLYSTDIVILSLFTSLITITTMIIYRNRLSDIILDILQMILGGGIMARLDQFPMRLVFVLATVVIFILRPGLEGTLSALMSSPDRSYVENLHDLNTFKYEVYMHTAQRQFIEDEKIWIGSDQKYLHYTNGSDVNCYYRVLNRSDNACIAFSTRLLPIAIKYKKTVHISESRNFKSYFTFWTRRNWALKKRVDQIASRLTEFGITEYWQRKAHKYPLKKLKALKKFEKSSEIFQIDFENLSFSHIFMAIMLILSIIVFLIEICCGVINEYVNYHTQE